MSNSKTARWVACAAAFCLAPVHAGVIAVDGDVPAIMDAGGTADDPARYVIGESGPQVRDFGDGRYVEVGVSEDHNQLLVQDSVITSRGLTIGAWGQNNRVDLRGSGTSWSTGFVTVGDERDNNVLTITQGASLSHDDGNVGIGNEGLNNRLVVDGPGSSLQGRYSQLYIGSEATASNNELIISNGGYASTLTASIGGDGSNNMARIVGMGSRWDLTSHLYLSLDEGATGNVLEVLNGGLVTVGEMIVVGTDSFLRLHGGFIAEYGDPGESDLQTLLAGGQIQFFDGEDWVVGSPEQFELTYIATDEEGLNLTGHDGLGGYTVLSSLATIPEPSAAGLALLGASLAMLSRRRG